jgi:hypothetical protein
VLSQISTTCTPLAVSVTTCAMRLAGSLSRPCHGERLGILSRYPFEVLFQQYDHFVLLDSQSGNPHSSLVRLSRYQQAQMCGRCPTLSPLIRKRLLQG